MALRFAQSLCNGHCVTGWGERVTCMSRHLAVVIAVGLACHSCLQITGHCGPIRDPLSCSDCPKVIRTSVVHLRDLFIGLRSVLE